MIVIHLTPTSTQYLANDSVSSVLAPTQLKCAAVERSVAPTITITA